MLRVILVRIIPVLIAAIFFCPGAISQSTSSKSYGQQINYKSAGLIESRTSNAAINHQITNSTRLDAFHNQTSTFMPYHQIDPTLTSEMIDHLRTISPRDAFFGKQTTGEKPEHQIDPTLTGSIIDRLRTLTPTDAFSGQKITGENQIDSTLTGIMIDHLPTLTPIHAFFGQQSTGEKPDHQIDSTLTGTMIDHPRILSPTDAFSGQHSTDENPDHQIDSTVAATNINQQTEPTSNVKPLGNSRITTVTASFDNKLSASTIYFAKTTTIVNTSLQLILKPTILISNNRPSFTASYEISGYQNLPTLTVSITNQPLTSTIKEKSRHILSTPSSMIDNHIFSTTLTIKETSHEIMSSYTPSVFINNQASMSTDEVMSQNIAPSRTDKITLQPIDSELTAALSKQTSIYQTMPVSNINLPDTSISNFGVTSQQIDSIPSGKISYQQTQATPTLKVTDTLTTQRSFQPLAHMAESNEPSQSGVIYRTITSSLLTDSIHQSIKPSTSPLSSITRIERSNTSTPSKKSTISSKSRSHVVSPSMTPTVPTSTSTTTQLPITKLPNEDVTVDVPVTLFLNRRTNTSFEKSSLRDKLQMQYKNVTGYIGINIYLFRLVSEPEISNSRRRRQAKIKLKVAYKVTLALLELEKANNLKAAGKKIIDVIHNKTADLFSNHKIDDLSCNTQQITMRRLTKDIEKLTENIQQLLCGIGYTFNETTKMCQSRCFNITCQNKGSCILDISGNAVCRCKKDGKYVFAGDFCGTKGERLLLASEYIIAAACGSGGIIIIVAIIICCICKSRTPKDKNEKDYYIADQATLSYNHPMGLFGRQRIPSNMYFSMRDSTYNVDDRTYTVIEDVTSKRGNTYIYNPSSEPSANTNTDSRSDHVYYNKSFCSEEFAIKRPHLRTERDSLRSDYNRPKIHRPDYM